MSFELNIAMCKLQPKLDMCWGTGRLYFLTSKCQVGPALCKAKRLQVQHNQSVPCWKDCTPLWKTLRSTPGFHFFHKRLIQTPAAWELYNIARKQPCKWMGQLLSHGKRTKCSTASNSADCVFQPTCCLQDAAGCMQEDIFPYTLQYSDCSKAFCFIIPSPHPRWHMFQASHPQPALKQLPRAIHIPAEYELLLALASVWPNCSSWFQTE